ncbi:unnamed protein product [Symbiodinium sp. CCMP2592]|nr:unnamed protein product [Symbiodinium sp. CCMP2592]
MTALARYLPILPLFLVGLGLIWLGHDGAAAAQSHVAQKTKEGAAQGQEGLEERLAYGEAPLPHRDPPRKHGSQTECFQCWGQSWREDPGQDRRSTTIACGIRLTFGRCVCPAVYIDKSHPRSLGSACIRHGRGVRGTARTKACKLSGPALQTSGKRLACERGAWHVLGCMVDDDQPALARTCGSCRAIGNKLDEDIVAAVGELQEVLVHQPSTASSEKVAAATSALGAVWHGAQEAEIQRIAVALKAFAAVGAPMPMPSHLGHTGGGQLSSGQLPAPAPFHMGDILAGPTAVLPSAHEGSEVSFGGAFQDVNMAPHTGSVTVDPAHIQVTRWRKRGSGTVDRPSKSPRRGPGPVDVGEPWAQPSTGLTPQGIPKPQQTEVEDDVELVPDPGAVQEAWCRAWLAVLAMVADSGSDVVGELSSCPEQDAALPNAVDEQAVEQVVQAAGGAWDQLLHVVAGPSLQLLEDLHLRLQDVLHRLRSCTGALSKVRQGVLVAAHAATGSINDPFSYAPGTWQEWLHPSLVVEQGLPQQGYLAAEVASNAHVQILCRLTCPFPRNVALALLALLPDAALSPNPRLLCAGISDLIAFLPGRGMVFCPQALLALSWASHRWHCAYELVLTFSWVTCLKAAVFGKSSAACGARGSLAGLRIQGARFRTNVRLRRSSGPRFKVTLLLLYLSVADGATLHLGAAVVSSWWLRSPTAVQLHAHGFHEGLSSVRGRFCPLLLLRKCARYTPSAARVTCFSRAPTAVVGTLLLLWVHRLGLPFSNLAPSLSWLTNGCMGRSCMPGLPPPWDSLPVSSLSQPSVGYFPACQVSSFFSLRLPVHGVKSGCRLTFVRWVADVDTLQFQIGPAADALQGEPPDGTLSPRSIPGLTTVCVPPPVSALAAVTVASRRDRSSLPHEWVEQCARGGFGLLHRELAVLPDQVLTSSVPIVVMFFPHVFRQDSSSSSEDQVGGWDTPGTSDTISALQHTLLPSPARASTSTALPACTGVTPSEFLNTSPPSALEPAAEPGSASSSVVSQFSGTRGILLAACVLRGLHHDVGSLLAWGVCLVISCGMPGNAVQMHSAPATPRDVVVSASRAPDRQVAAPAGAHTHLQARWLQIGDFGEGPLWSALPSASEVFLITCRLWWPGSSVRLEFANTESARDAAAELYRQAIRLGRPQIVAASSGPTLEAVNLVSLPPRPETLTVLLDLGREVVCVELPKDYSADHVLAAAQTAAASADVQILRGTAHRLRQGDVVRVRVSTEARTLDVSAFVIPHNDGTASRWLQEGRIVSLLHPVAGVLSFEVPRACDLDASVLGALLRSVTPGQHVFVALPGADILPHAAFVAAFPGQDCVTYRLTDASDPSAVGLHLAFSGVFESFPAFLESLLRSNRPAAALLRRLQPFGLSVLTWECTSFPGRADCRYWHVHVQADFARAREHLLSISWEPRLVRTPPPLPPPRTRVFHSIGSQTNAPFISASTPAAVLQAPPSVCGAGVTPDSASELVDLWCDAWHVKCLVACLPGFTVWALREGSRLYGMCTPAPSWEAVAQALSLSLWELPQTFLSSDSRVWPFPRDITGVAMQCVSVGYDSPEGVSQLVRNCEAETPSPPPPPSPLASAALGLPCLRRHSLLCALSLLLPVVSVRVTVEPAPLISHLAESETLQTRRDFSRPCTMSWTHELARQTHGFALSAPQLGAYVTGASPHSEVQMHLWLPGQGPVHLRVGARHLDQHLSAYLGAFLPDCEYGLHVAFDSSPQVLDLLVSPPSPYGWWILRDSIGCELLRPVVQHYTSHCSFFFCAVEPDGVVHNVEPSAEVRHMSPCPQGARALITRVFPGLEGKLVDGVLQIVAARARPPSLLGSLALLMLCRHVASMQPPQLLALAPVAEAPPPPPTTIRIWTLNINAPVDLPWRPQGYPTRWLRELMCRLHHIDDPGEFRPTHSTTDSSVQHVLFVPVVPATRPTVRFWLLHWGDAAAVTFGHSPFSWDVVSAHLRALFPGGHLPERSPALSYAGQLYPPGAALPDFPSGAVIQILIGALARIPGDDDPWNPDPLVVEGPYFRHVPSRGPALEPAILLDGHGNRRAAGASHVPLVDQEVQTDLSGNGTGLDHATVSRVHMLSQELSFHTSRLWAGLAEPDAEPAGESQPVLRLASQSTCAAVNPSTVDLLDIASVSSCRRQDRLSVVILTLICTRGYFGASAFGRLLALATLGAGSIISAPPASSDDEQSEDEGPPPVQAFNMSAAEPNPVSRPAGPPPPEPVNAPFQPRMWYLRAARPLEDYALGLWPSSIEREPAADEDTVRRVQADLLGLQRGLRSFAAAIPLGTPFCIHNPFTARQQCELVEYSAGPEINPFVLFRGHARSRGWADIVPLQPQPDATAVHLIGCPQAPGNAAVGIVLEGRLVPCCLPVCVGTAALRALQLDGSEYDLRPPEVQEGSSVVQFRNGDCLAVRPRSQSRSPPPPAQAAALAAPTSEAEPAAGSPDIPFSSQGGFPWGTDPINRDFSAITAEDPVYVVLHSPFLGVFPPYTASHGTRHGQVWAQFLNDDPGWASDFFPVWPGPAFNELSMVPVGQDAALVTIMLMWRGHHRATLTPRTMTVAWLTDFISRHINSPVDGISLPHGLAICELFDVPPAAFRFRNGDVVYIHDPPEDPSEPLEFVDPWHLQDGLAAHHAPWATGFQLMFGISVHLLRPNRPPLLASVSAGEAWCPESFTFTGTFRNHFPGMWTPVQWSSARALQLIEVHGVAAQVNVVAASPEGRLCRTVDRIASRDSLADQLHFLPGSLQVGGVPSYALNQACELRNGDVVFGDFARGACGGRPLLWGLVLGLVPALSSCRMGTFLSLLLGSLVAHSGLFSRLLMLTWCLPGSQAMVPETSVLSQTTSSAIPQAAPPRVLVTVANPFAPWHRVEADPRHLFDDVMADAHRTLTSWHRGFAATGLVLEGPGDAAAATILHHEVELGVLSSLPNLPLSSSGFLNQRGERPRVPLAAAPARFFPPAIDFNDGEPYVPLGGWQPDNPDGPLARCFPGPRPLTARVLCPLRGWSETSFLDTTRSWRSIEQEGTRHCGLWAHRFFPVRAVLPISQITIAPVAPYGLATVALHIEGCSAVALASVDSSLDDIHRLAVRVFPHTRFWRVIAPPVLRTTIPNVHIRLRNGDAFSLLPEPSDPGATRYPLLQYASLERARQVASWSLPFRFDSGGYVCLWYTGRRSGHSIRIRDTGYWDPEGPTFWSLNGRALSGSWVPVLSGDLSSLHLVHSTSTGEAHVLLLMPPDLEPQGLLLAGCNAFRAPPGWRLLPALQYVRADSPLRDGDVLVLDPTADTVWDPTGPPLQSLAGPAPGPVARPRWGPSSSVAAAISGRWVWLAVLSARWPRLLALACLVGAGQGMIPALDLPEQPIRVGFFPWRAPAAAADLVDLTNRTEIDIVLLSPFTGPQEAGSALLYPGALHYLCVLDERGSASYSRCKLSLFAHPVLSQPMPHLTKKCAGALETWLSHFLLQLLRPNINPRAFTPTLKCGIAPSGLLTFRSPPASASYSGGPLFEQPGDTRRQAAAGALLTILLTVTLACIILGVGFRFPGSPRITPTWFCCRRTPRGSMSLWKQTAIAGVPLSQPLLMPGNSGLSSHLSPLSPASLVSHTRNCAKGRPFAAAMLFPAAQGSSPPVGSPALWGLRLGGHSALPPRPRATFSCLLGCSLSLRCRGRVFPTRAAVDSGLWLRQAATDQLPNRLAFATASGTLLGASLDLFRGPPALQEAAPAWSDFTRVRPPQDHRFIDWVPVPSAPLFATVLIQCPPATRAALLPATCAVADLARASRHSIPDLSYVLAFFRGLVRYCHDL